MCQYYFQLQALLYIAKFSVILILRYSPTRYRKANDSLSNFLETRKAETDREEFPIPLKMMVKVVLVDMVELKMLVERVLFCFQYT